MIGKTLSHYKVLEKIGQGGMGEVYRAEDTNLSREVAIKVLPEKFTKDPQRLARFEREAKLLASLNHPNIAAIYGFEEADDVRFLALELVPGETLQERVAKGPVPVEEALEVCRQIAEGVEAAHEKGVIHRDLKPANVKVTPEGKVKILDFGLAKAFEDEMPAADISQSPTLTEEMTRAGVILGTAAYMSPEQAKGEAVDKRADIFAFGCVLYELLTGKKTFDGKTITETLGAIIHKEPDWDGLPATTPWRIQELLRRCLTKDAHDRLRDIANVRVEIKLALYEPATVLPIGVGGAAQPLRRGWMVTAGVALVGAVIMGLAVWVLAPQPTRPVARFVVGTSATEPFSSQLPTRGLAISPDGTRIVYRSSAGGGAHVYLRAMDQLEGTRLFSAQNSIGNPFFSPDGAWVVFSTNDDGTWKKVSILGGPPVTLFSEEGVAPRGASWGPDDTIILGRNAPGTGLFRGPAAGGDLEVLTTPDAEQGEINHWWPEILPGGDAVLFTIVKGQGAENAEIAVLDLATSEQKVLIRGGSNPQYALTGHIIYGVDGTLRAVPFDLDRLGVTGEPVPMLEGVMTDAGGAVEFSLSADGSLVYAAGGTQTPERTLVWVDREGAVEPLGAPARAYLDPRFSPDGRRLAVRINGENRDIWVYDLGRRTLSRLTFDPGVDETPVWTPDGKWVTFSGVRDGVANLLRRVADGSEEEEQLVTLQEHTHADSWSPNGQVLVFSMGPTGTASGGIWLLPLEEDREPTLFLKTPFNVYTSRLSPDGHWIAYASDESGRLEIYVQPFPGLGGKWPISTDGGGHAVWSRDGRELFYRNGDKMMVVEVTTQPNFSAGSPKALFEGQFFITGDGNTSYDVAPDGQRLLMIQESAEQQRAQINVVLNWFEELKRLVPTN